MLLEKVNRFLFHCPELLLTLFHDIFCMLALGTGGSCMAVYEYLLMLRLT